ncbi:MAG TPA: hypothetical protein VEL11_09460 [Candidatus Bathyarchaeia archaeon]|nr:hypothetical protein [Candidatus Bathyarchaeia archaeon]
MPLNKSWHDYNESLIERGRVLIDVSFLKSSNKEIKKMNIGGFYLLKPSVYVVVVFLHTTYYYVQVYVVLEDL